MKNKIIKKILTYDKKAMKESSIILNIICYFWNIIPNIIYMKKTLAVVLFLSAFTVGMYGQFTHIGAAAGYGLSVKEPGFGLYGMYTINEQIKIVPSLMYYLPHDITVENWDNLGEYAFDTFTWWIANLDGNYVVVNQDAFQAYGLMGLSMAYLKGEQGGFLGRNDHPCDTRV